MQFTKMQGVGNDFVVVDEFSLPPGTDYAHLARQMCERHFGVGADGLLTVGKNSETITMRMFNPDGTEDMCGNGLRCAALWAFSNGWTEGRHQFQIETRDGVKACHILSEKTADSAAQIEVEMSYPLFDANSIPIVLADGADPLNTTIDVDGKIFEIAVLNTGSTHTIIYGPQPDETTFQRYSPCIENHPAFPERTSIMWTTKTGEHALQIRIWERGAGETLGCGTGACAAVVALTQNGLINAGEPTDVKSLGGVLTIRWDGDSPVHMTGPAAFVYSGCWPGLTE